MTTSTRLLGHHSCRCVSEQTFNAGSDNRSVAVLGEGVLQFPISRQELLDHLCGHSSSVADVYALSTCPGSDNTWTREIAVDDLRRDTAAPVDGDSLLDRPCSDRRRVREVQVDHGFRDSASITNGQSTLMSPSSHLGGSPLVRSDRRFCTHFQLKSTGTTDTSIRPSLLLLDCANDADLRNSTSRQEQPRLEDGYQQAIICIASGTLFMDGARVVSNACPRWTDCVGGLCRLATANPAQGVPPGLSGRRSVPRRPQR